MCQLQQIIPNYFLAGCNIFGHNGIRLNARRLFSFGSLKEDLVTEMLSNCSLLGLSDLTGFVGFGASHVFCRPLGFTEDAVHLALKAVASLCGPEKTDKQRVHVWRSKPVRLRRRTESSLNKQRKEEC